MATIEDVYLALRDVSVTFEAVDRRRRDERDALARVTVHWDDGPETGMVYPGGRTPRVVGPWANEDKHRLSRLYAAWRGADRAQEPLPRDAAAETAEQPAEGE